jgi:hypothetical protein
MLRVLNEMPEIHGVPYSTPSCSLDSWALIFALGFSIGLDFGSGFSLAFGVAPFVLTSRLSPHFTFCNMQAKLQIRIGIHTGPAYG